MERGEGFVCEEVAAFRILGEDAVGDVIGHRAQDIALQSQLFLRLGVQGKGPVEPPRRIIGANHRGDRPHANVDCLMLRGVQMREKVMLQSFEYELSPPRQREAKPRETCPIGAAAQSGLRSQVP